MRLAYRFWTWQRPALAAAEPSFHLPSMITFLNVMLGSFSARPAGQEIPPDGGSPTLKEQSVGQSTRNCHRPRTVQDPLGCGFVHSTQTRSETLAHWVRVCQT